MNSVSCYGSEFHSRPNSGFAAAETNSTLAGSSLFTTGRTNDRMEFQHFPDSKPARRQSRSRTNAGAIDDQWTRDENERPTAATGSFVNWHRLTQKKTSDDKKGDVPSRCQNTESGPHLLSEFKEALFIIRYSGHLCHWCLFGITMNVKWRYCRKIKILLVSSTRTTISSFL